MKEGSPHLADVNRWIQLMLQMGFHERWIDNLMPNATKCDGIDSIIASHEQKSSSSASLTLLQTSGLFLILLMGLSISVFVFGMETLVAPLLLKPWKRKPLPKVKVKVMRQGQNRPWRMIKAHTSSGNSISFWRSPNSL